ncbi:hypothetical protein A9K97_gp437 [Tokyovirus A1]|uniref:hypothetical protein n=1 Tax=Tokyovirus A1 TaxID=1826170 RepID=UPI0007A96A9E|nr:hypothetical protein A9K97_gp437 [Tokyovirus A1]BAU79914.1 hypothetical protein [Tokyovirus A1]
MSQREKLSLSFSDWGAKRDLEDIFEARIRASNKIRTFWKRYGRKMHLGEGAKREAFIDDVKGTPENFLYSMGNMRNGWMKCKKTSDFSFRLNRTVDTVCLLRITGKNIWKIVVAANGSPFPVYIKKRNKKTTFCVELPFSLPLFAMPFSEIIIDVYGEEVEKMEMKGAQALGNVRSTTKAQTHILFYRRAIIKGGECKFAPFGLRPKGEVVKRNVSALFE